MSTSATAFGTRVALVPANANAIAAGTLGRQVPLMLGGIPQGEVRVGVSTEAIDLDIETPSPVAAHQGGPRRGAGVGLLAVGLFYSLAPDTEEPSAGARAPIFGTRRLSGEPRLRSGPRDSQSAQFDEHEPADARRGAPGRSRLEGGEHVEMLRSMQGRSSASRTSSTSSCSTPPGDAHFEVKI
jgi:hypothetical protein